MRKAALFIILICLLFITTFACSINDPSFKQQLSVDTEIQDLSVRDDEKPRLELKDSIDSMWAVKDGKVFCIQKFSGDTGHDKIATEIENAVCVYQSRYVYCKDGSCVDLYGSPFERWSYYLYPDVDPILREGSEWDGTYPVFELIKELKSSCGIRRIEKISGMVKSPCFIYANNGKVYQFTDPAEQYIEHDDILTVDGKIRDEKFHETTSWENVIDYCACKDFIIALTAYGNVLSSGIDFSVDNAVKIDIIDNYDIPVALTSDGKLVFGDSQQFSDILTQAESFTDIVDFTYYVGNDLVILAQKSDGSLIATTNDIYNPEYVSQP